MMIISFAWTTPAVRVGVKTCTRREWTDKYALRFKKGDLLQGYDRNPRIGGRPFCIIELTHQPVKQLYSQVPNTDWYAEGFDYMESHGLFVGGLPPHVLWHLWKQSTISCWVVRFWIRKIFEGKPLDK